MQFNYVCLYACTPPSCFDANVMDLHEIQWECRVNTVLYPTLILHMAHFKPHDLDSGKMSFQVDLTAFLNGALDGLKISTCVSVQVSDHSYCPHRQHSQALNGLLTTTSKTCNGDILPTGAFFTK
jgi:hypothetical protein